ncbi:exostosin-1-like [Panonychus citri]|uniref:exostosin-1-like n=1 Tax=Panonychus citri TaxID=50023 RepID=UPI0023074CA6|nr:exostosin-1-like [Panonychus citri]
MKGKKRYSLIILATILFILIYFILKAISYSCDAGQSNLKPRSSLIDNYFSFVCKYKLTTIKISQVGERISKEEPIASKQKVRLSYLDDGQIWYSSDSSDSSDSKGDTKNYPKSSLSSIDNQNKEITNEEKTKRGKSLDKENSGLPEFPRDCRFSNCFNFNRCPPGERLRIHIYPELSKLKSSSPPLTISSTYQKIITIIESSIYYEPDPDKACLFITRYDYLDRDRLSLDFQKNLPSLLPLDNGRNHIVFNLYSGTWPDYRELDLAGFTLGYSILAKASFSYQHFRPGFDISIPLFSKNHPIRGKTFIEPDEGPEYQLADEIAFETVETNVYKVNEKKNLLVFKGKRYTHGIGSETRNTLYHLHNDHDILIYTTCKHGKKWKDAKDERCTKDNRDYDKYDYLSLMANSTFCLVPRGRRLGSFRFLEALAFGCIPVLLSNNWVKPFEDVIDWSEAVVEGDERSLLQLPEIMRSYDWKKIEKMASRSKSLYDTYFSSVEKIVFTTIAIINERIHSHLSLNSFLWNLVNPGFSGFTGAIWFDTEYSCQLKDYPGYGKLSQFSPSSLISQQSATSSQLTRSSSSSTNLKDPFDGFTTILYINKPIMPSSIHRLIKSLSKSQYLIKIIIIWTLPDNPPSNLLKNPYHDSSLVNVIVPEIKTINAKLKPYKEIETYAVLTLQPDTTITAEELDFAYLVWCSFPHRIIGFTARDHYYDEFRSRWYYTSKWTNYYSIILLDAAFYHRYYNNLYTNYISSNQFFSQDPNNWDDEICVDLLFNFLISHITREGPIKVTQRKRTSNSSSSLYNLINTSNTLTSKFESFTGSQECFTYLYNLTFNYVPLIKSQMRFDPVLFKDSVSNLRKKYRRSETVN